jgi:branched-chain amino acid transport system permease protein
VFVSIFLFVGLVVGGVSSIGGTLIGAAFIEFVPNLADKVSKAAPGAVYGVILIAVMFLMPSGAGGFLYAMTRRLFRSRSCATAEPSMKIDAESCERASGLTSMKTGAPFVDPPVVSGNTGEGD